MAEADRLNRIPVLTMIRAVTYLKRRPGMPVAEFQTYWREQHPAVVKKLPWPATPSTPTP